MKLIKTPFIFVCAVIYHHLMIFIGKPQFTYLADTQKMAQGFVFPFSLMMMAAVDNLYPDGVVPDISALANTGLKIVICILALGVLAVLFERKDRNSSLFCVQAGSCTAIYVFYAIFNKGFGLEVPVVLYWLFLAYMMVNNFGQFRAAPEMVQAAGYLRHK